MAVPTITVVHADAHFALTPRNAAWTAVTDKAIQLEEAQRWLKTLCFDEKADCCGRSFDASYTEAASELALAMSLSPTAILGGSATSSAADVIKRVAVGSLSVEYAVGESSSTRASGRYGVNAPTVLQRFPWLGDILGCFLVGVPSGSGARIIDRVRS